MQPLLCHCKSAMAGTNDQLCSNGAWRFLVKSSFTDSQFQQRLQQKYMIGLRKAGGKGSVKMNTLAKLLFSLPCFTKTK